MGFLDSLFGPKESEEVTRLREKAEAGDAVAMYELANAYSFGKDVKQDPAKVLEWMEKAANAGCSSAQVEMGLSYANGYLHKVNYAAAFEWYQKAAAQGQSNAIANLKNLGITV